MRRADLEARPWREVEDYLLYIQLIAREEAARDAQQRRANGRR